MTEIYMVVLGLLQIEIDTLKCAEKGNIPKKEIEVHACTLLSINIDMLAMFI